jgi:hypothetical protein
MDLTQIEVLNNKVRDIKEMDSVQWSWNFSGKEKKKGEF